MLRIYLDNCCYNRPFDDQTPVIIQLETQAKLLIQARIREGAYSLVWSYVLDYEVGRIPSVDRQEAIMPWKEIAEVFVQEETPEILALAGNLRGDGVKTFDALHLACAAAAQCDFFITTDKRLLRAHVPNLRIVNPLQFVTEMEGDAT